VRLSTAAANVERVVWHYASVEAIDDESCRLLMNVDTFEWPAIVLASVGADFEVLEPPELRDYLQRVGEFFLRRPGTPR
jgi:predicted DNA-binding transcriptional regulator YafY